MKDINVVFMGTPEFAVPILKKLIDNTNVILVVSQPDSIVGRKKVLTPSPVKKLAIENGIEVFTPLKIRDDYSKITSLKPDLIITCAYGQFLPEELLNSARIASINVHASLLPKLRGGAPIQYSLINGFEKTGVTIMYMDKHMDTGDIISSKSVDIDIKDNLESLSLKLSKIGSELLIDTLPSIIEGTNKRIKQNDEEATYAYNITKEEELLDFNSKAVDVYNKIRGLNPNPGAYFVLNNNVMKVYESRIGESTSQKSSTISNIYKDGIGINCADKEIILTKIKPAGKKIMDAKDYLNGINKEELLRGVINEV